LTTQVDEPEDTKAIADTYTAVFNMGFEPSLADIKKKFGDGWEKKAVEKAVVTPPAPEAMPEKNPQAAAVVSKMPVFAESTKDVSDQLQVADYVRGLDLGALSEGMVTMVTNAIAKVTTLEELQAALPAILAETDTQPLQHALEAGYLGAAALGAVKPT
jgi:phage gp29-like protein